MIIASYWNIEERSITVYQIDTHIKNFMAHLQRTTLDRKVWR